MITNRKCPFATAVYVWKRRQFGSNNYPKPKTRRSFVVDWPSLTPDLNACFYVFTLSHLHEWKNKMVVVADFRQMS